MSRRSTLLLLGPRLARSEVRRYLVHGDDAWILRLPVGDAFDGAEWDFGRPSASAPLVPAVRA